MNENQISLDEISEDLKNIENHLKNENKIQLLIFNSINDFVECENITFEQMCLLIKDDSNFQHICEMAPRFGANNLLKVLSNNQELLEELSENQALMKVLMKLIKLVISRKFYFSNPTILNYTKEIDIYNYLKNHHNHYFFNRGQANFDWNLIPSIVREIVNTNENFRLDLKSIFKLYSFDGKKTSLLQRYNEAFPDSKVCRPSDINYRFLAWMQHTASYSPFIDFTKDFLIASSFAFGGNPKETALIGSPTLFILEECEANNIIKTEDQSISDIDACQIDKNKAETRPKVLQDYINEIEINILNSKIIPGTKLNIQNCFGTFTTLDFTSIDNISNYLIPKYKIIDIPTNDRMIKQKGAFLFIYKYTVINKNIFPVFGVSTFCFKHKIIDKEFYLNKINENPFYLSFEYLMNPYDLFKKGK